MKAKAKIYGCTLLQCSWPGNHAIGGQEDKMKDYTFSAEAISLLLAIGYTSGVRKVGSDTVRRDEKTKSVVKSVVPTVAKPTTHPTHQTNPNQSKTKTLSTGYVGIY
jgi:hypothetical protein